MATDTSCLFHLYTNKYHDQMDREQEVGYRANDGTKSMKKVKEIHQKGRETGCLD